MKKGTPQRAHNPVPARMYPSRSAKRDGAFYLACGGGIGHNRSAVEGHTNMGFFLARDAGIKIMFRLSCGHHLSQEIRAEMFSARHRDERPLAVTCRQPYPSHFFRPVARIRLR